MKERTKKKFATLAVIFVISSAASVAAAKVAEENEFLRNLVIIVSAALAGFVVSAKERDPLLPNNFKAWVGFIIAALFVTVLFWALEHYVFS